MTTSICVNSTPINICRIDEMLILLLSLLRNMTYIAYPFPKISTSPTTTSISTRHHDITTS